MVIVGFGEASIKLSKYYERNIGDLVD